MRIRNFRNRLIKTLAIWTRSIFLVLLTIVSSAFPFILSAWLVYIFLTNPDIVRQLVIGILGEARWQQALEGINELTQYFTEHQSTLESVDLAISLLTLLFGLLFAVWLTPLGKSVLNIFGSIEREYSPSKNTQLITRPEDAIALELVDASVLDFEPGTNGFVAFSSSGEELLIQRDLQILGRFWEETNVLSLSYNHELFPLLSKEIELQQAKTNPPSKAIDLLSFIQNQIFVATFKLDKRFLPFRYLINLGVQIEIKGPKGGNYKIIQDFSTQSRVWSTLPSAWPRSTNGERDLIQQLRKVSFELFDRSTHEKIQYSFPVDMENLPYITYNAIVAEFSEGLTQLLRQKNQFLPNKIVLYLTTEVGEYTLSRFISLKEPTTPAILEDYFCFHDALRDQETQPPNTNLQPPSESN